MLTELNNKCVKATFKQESNSMQAIMGVEIQLHIYTHTQPQH